MILARIDDLQAAFDSLDSSVRAFLASHSQNVDALEQELATLRADDAVEDSKLEGITAAVDDLRGAVDVLSVPEAPPAEPGPVEPAPDEPAPEPEPEPAPEPSPEPEVPAEPSPDEPPAEPTPENQ
jgi:outer membrane biosynthesis protein TonB